MADNTVLNTGSGGDTLATDDIAGIKYPRSKLVIGADGTNDGDVSAANPLPVKGTGTAGTANAGVVTVQGVASMTPVQIADNSGSITVDAPVATPVFVRLSDGSAAITTLATDTLQTSGNASLTSIDGKTPALGQALAAGSSPVVLTAAQITTLTPVAAITGFATETTLAALNILEGAVTETAPATDTASSGLNGRLQRIAQRLTSLIAQIPATLGIKTAAASLSVAPASDATFALAAETTKVIGTINVAAAQTLATVTTVSTVTNVATIGTSVTPGTGAAHLGKAEDAVHTTGDTGVMAFAVRRDANTTLVDATGDYAPMQVDANGSLKVAIISGAGSGGTAAADNAAFTPGTTSFTPIGGEVDDTGTSAATENSAAACRMTVQRALHVNLRDNAGAELSVGGGTQYTEDAAAAGNPVGNALIVVREDARAGSLVSADGDNIALRGNNLGELYVKHTDALTVNSHAVTNAGTFVVQATLAAGATAIAKAEDVASADADVGVPFMAVRKATPANTSGTDGDYEFAQISAGRLWGSVIVDTALPAGTNAIGKLASNTGVTIGAVELAASQTLANVTTVGTVTTVSTVTAVTTVTTVTTCGTVTTLTGSAVVHDAADSGNPHKIGARAVTSVSAQTLVAANDRTDIFAGLDGVLITRPYCNLEDIVSGNATNTDGTSTQCIAAQAAGIKTYLSSVVLANSSASNITVDIKDGTTIKTTIPVPAGGGAVYNPPVPIPGTAATAWNFDGSAAATTLTCSMVGFKSKV